MEANLKPLLSIIVPCYNAGHYLTEALESVKNYKGVNLIEIIIVDDGSTDITTIGILSQLEFSGELIIRQENLGPAAARNTGVKLAKGDFILFLDSDNKIRSEYIEKGIAILKQKTEIGVVHGNPFFFGDTNTPRFYTGPFEITKLLGENYIDICSVIRKQVWTDVDGFDENRILIGHEDWDFWIRIFQSGWKFHYIDETLFDYRVSGNSLLAQAMHPEKYVNMIQYLHGKHSFIYLQYYRKLYVQKKYYLQDKQKPFRSFIKYIYNKYLIK